MRRRSRCFLILLLLVLASAGTASAQTNSYTQTNLSSDTAGTATLTSPDLINPWGIAFVPGNPFWIADNNNGKTTLYDKTGNLLGNFTIPPPHGSSAASTPTGVVANTQDGFKVAGISSQFIFATEDGTISGWYPTLPTAVLAVDNSTHGVVYKGLALVSNNGTNTLLAANFNSGTVEAFDTNFNPVTLAGSFADPTLPSGFAPFGIHVIGANQVLITYAQQDTAKHDPIHAAGAGYVTLFDTQGNFVRRVASQGNLNSPWGATIAPSTFGMFQRALLIGNFGDGTINAFDLNSGNLLGQLQDAHGNVITNASLWELLFDARGQTGNPNTLYFTAGLNNEQHGLFGAITANNTTQPAAADFSLTASPSTQTISAGQPASFMLSVTALDGFNSAVTFSCSGEPANSSCSFSPNTVTANGANAVTTTLTIATNSNPYHPAVKHGMSGTWMPLSVFGLVGMVVVETRRRRRLFRCFWWRWISYACGVGTSGCSGGNSSASMSSGNGTQRGASTVVMNATSGSISHSTNVSLAVQ
ncbi:MAG TPA: TIGR03118 family protein [Candidatus Sulfotelmatobacter sp.]|nr:TIGR03118 family protein [Candidatus Sulfotelmatobacter sp.]